MRRLYRTIAGRIFLSFSSVMVAGILIVGVAGVRLADELVNEAARNQLRVLAVSISNQVQRYLRRTEGSLRNLQQTPFLLDALQKSPFDRGEFEAALKRRLAATPAFEDFAVFDQTGLCIAATDLSWNGFNASKETFFVMGLKHFYFGEIFDSPDEGKVQLISAPIGSNVQPRGVLVGQLNLNAIDDLMDQKLGVGESAEAFLLDTNLRFITPGKSGPEDLLRSHLTTTALTQHLKEEFWVGRYKNFRGSDVLGTVIKVPGYNWYLAIERSYEDVHSQVVGIVKVIVATLLGVMLVFQIMTYFITRSITRPLNILMDGAQRISQGAVKQPILIPRGHDEIRFLAIEFERMRAKIAAYQGKLLEKLEASEQRRMDSERLAAIGTLAATLAHEIRNPLNAMSLLLSNLERKMPDDNAPRKIMESIRLEIGRLDRMIADILDYAKPLQLERAPVNMPQLVQSVLDFYRPTLEREQVHAELQQHGTGPFTILGDRDRLQQCLVNLVQNAIDAQKNTQRPKRLTVRIEANAAELSIEILDEGSGIPREAQSRIFDLFFTTKEKGTGLGLSTVRKIIDAHGGAIALKNREGGGALVRMQFPRVSQI